MLMGANRKVMLSCAAPAELLLPSRRQTLLLQACLAGGDSAADAWRKWCDLVGDPRRAITQDLWNIKSILPLLYNSLRTADIAVEKDLQTVLRTAAFHEQLRFRTISRLCDELAQALAARGTSAVLTGELAVAHRAYDPPFLRHSASVVLLMREADIPGAVESLRPFLWKPIGEMRRGSEATRMLKHASGLVLHLSWRPLRIEGSRQTFEQVVRRSTLGRASKGWFAVACPADLLLWAMERMLVEGSWRRLDWACDCVMLLRRFSPGDWQDLLNLAEQDHLSQPVMTSLRYLSRSLPVALPLHAKERLEQTAARDPASAAIARSCAAAAIRANPLTAMRSARNAGQAIFVLRSMRPLPALALKRWVRNRLSGYPRLIDFLRRCRDRSGLGCGPVEK
jgi:hypothetical protein